MSEKKLILAEDYNLILKKPHPIYLGSLPFKPEELPVDTIFNFCRQNESAKLPNNKILVSFPIFDKESPDAIPAFRDIKNFIEVAKIYVESGPTYWHCMAGINRSTFMLALFLWKTKLMDGPMDNIIEYLRSIRGDVLLSNKEFHKYLLGLER